MKAIIYSLTNYVNLQFTHQFFIILDLSFSLFYSFVILGGKLKHLIRLRVDFLIHHRLQACWFFNFRADKFHEACVPLVTNPS